MVPAAIPANEAERIAALRRYEILDTPAELEFDDFTHLASFLCDTPMALISLVDSGRQWFKSKLGIEAAETAREISFCGHAIHGTGLFEIPNAREDERFRDNPLVLRDPKISFYAGMPLTTPEGLNLGALCVMDRVPRQLTSQQKESLARLGRQVMRQMELRLAQRRLQEELGWRAQSEAKLEKALKELKDIKVALDEHSVVAVTDAAGVITEANSKFCELSKYSREELIGQDHRLINSGLHSREFFRDLWDTINAGKVWKGEIRNRAKDGSYYWVDSTIFPFVKADGTVYQFVAIRTDITARKEVEGAMQEQLRFQAFSADIGKALNSAGSLAEILKVCAQEMVEHLEATLAQIYVHQAADKRLELYASAGAYTAETGPRQALPTGGSAFGFITAELQPYFTDQAGSDPNMPDPEWVRREGLVAFAGYPLVVEGRLVGVMALYARRIPSQNILRSITTVAGQIALGIERRRVEEQKALLLEQLEAVNKDLSDFAYVVSHDLKAPLRGIGSLANWLATDYGDRLGANGREQLNLLMSRVRRMGALIDGILAYSRAGRVREQRVEINLNAIVANVIDMLAPPPNVKVRVAERLPTVRMDPVKAQQVFQNLLGNALKYLDKPEGNIVVSGEPTANGWKLSVADNGPGIEEKYFDKIFQLFQTLGTQGKVEGSGVGLALVKRIVESEGGRVWVESEVGRGATFYFTLPRPKP